MKIPNFATKQELFKFLKTNKSELIAEKKYSVKHADAFNYSVPVFNPKGEAIKAADMSGQVDLESIKATVVINTTNILDSHGDVHIPGLWKKSLSEIKKIYL